jgi:hypothetical protein
MTSKKKQEERERLNQAIEKGLETLASVHTPRSYKNLVRSVATLLDARRRLGDEETHDTDK